MMYYYIASVILYWIIVGIGVYWDLPEIVGDTKYLSLIDILMHLLVSLIPIINVCVVCFSVIKICNSRITLNPMNVHYDIKQRRFVYLSQQDVIAAENRNLDIY